LSFRPYVEHGFSLCAIRDGEKRPRGDNWNSPERALTTEQAERATAAGLMHAYSGRAAVASATHRGVCRAGVQPPSQGEAVMRAMPEEVLLWCVARGYVVTPRTSFTRYPSVTGDPPRMCAKKRRGRSPRKAFEMRA